MKNTVYFIGSYILFVILLSLFLYTKNSIFYFLALLFYGIVGITNYIYQKEKLEFRTTAILKPLKVEVFIQCFSTLTLFVILYIYIYQLSSPLILIIIHIFLL